MSRSYRQTPITGITMACSEKWHKRHANRKLRCKVKAGALDLRLSRAYQSRVNYFRHSKE